MTALAAAAFVGLGVVLTLTVIQACLMVSRPRDPWDELARRPVRRVGDPIGWQRGRRQ